MDSDQSGTYKEPNQKGTGVPFKKNKFTIHEFLHTVKDWKTNIMVRLDNSNPMIRKRYDNQLKHGFLEERKSKKSIRSKKSRHKDAVKTWKPKEESTTLNDDDFVPNSFRTKKPKDDIFSNDNQEAGNLIQPNYLKILGEMRFEREYLGWLLKAENTRILDMRKKATIESNDIPARLLQEKILLDIMQRSKEMRDLIHSGISSLDEYALLESHVDIFMDICDWQMSNRKKIGTNKAHYKRLVNIRAAHFAICAAWNAYYEKCYCKCIHQLCRLNKTIINNWSYNVYAMDKTKCLSDIYCLAGMCFLELEEYKEAEKYFRKEQKLGVQHKLINVIYRSQDNLARLAGCCGYYKLALSLYKERLISIHSDTERAWIFFQMALCNVYMGCISKAIKLSLKSLEAAKICQNFSWILNVHSLIANCCLFLSTTLQPRHVLVVTSLEHLEMAYKASLFVSNGRACVALINLLQKIYEVFRSEGHLSILEHLWSINLIQMINVKGKAHSGKSRISQNSITPNNKDVKFKKTVAVHQSRDKQVHVEFQTDTSSSRTPSVNTSSSDGRALGSVITASTMPVVEVI